MNENFVDQWHTLNLPKQASQAPAKKTSAKILLGGGASSQN